MPITLKEVMNLEKMKNATLQFGEKILEDTPVEWVSVIETPVENFVRNDELILTTGIGLTDHDTLFKFVQEIIHGHASALAIATGKFIHTIPDSVMQLAAEKEFPIILLPWETRFADIMKDVLQSLNEHRNQIVEKSQEMQQKLLQLILRGGGINDIASFVHKILKKPILITDNRGQMKGASHQSSSLKSAWNKYLHDEQYAVSLLPHESQSFLTSQHLQYITIDEHTVLQMTIQSASEVQGYLITELSAGGSLHPQSLELLEHAATTVALCFLRESTIKETEMRLKDDFVWSLAKEGEHSWDHVLSRSKSLGYHVTLPYICLIGYPENLAELGQHHNQAKNAYENWHHKMIRKIEDEIYYAGRKLNSETMYTFQQDQFIIFLEINDRKVDETVKPFIEWINIQLKTLFPNLMLSWGIAKTAGLKCFQTSFIEAQTALEMGRRQHGPGHENTYSDTRFDRALLALASHAELREITDAAIGALLNYEQERGIDLIHTYQTYSNNRGNVSQTARQLNLHRQSLLYRLRKIEALTECKLENHDDVLLLDLSIKLWTTGILEKK